MKYKHRFREGYSKISTIAFAIVLLSSIGSPSLYAQEAEESTSEALIERTAEETSADRIANAVAAAAVDEGATDAETGLRSEVLNPEIDTQELEFRLVPLTKDELGILAAEWLEIVKAKTEEVMAAQIAIAKTEGDIEEAARDHLTELVHARKLLFDKYSRIVSAWEKKGGDPDEVAIYRMYRSSIIVEETRTADLKTLLAQAYAWAIAKDGGVQLVKDVVVIVLAVIGLFLFARIVRRIVHPWIGRVPNLTKLLQTFLVTVIYWLVMAIGLMVVLSAMGIDISPVFALIGGASFILAFAFQETLGNLASGLMIMVNRPFDEGDYVDVGGVAGTVKSLSIVATTIVTPDNQVILIPNRNVWGNVITNVTASDTRRVDLLFGISYDDSIADAVRVMDQVVRAHPLVHKEPEPMIRVHELADSSVNFICRPWTNTVDYWTVYWDITQQVKEGFDAAGISIPFPQRDVHLKSSSDMSDAIGPEQSTSSKN